MDNPEVFLSSLNKILRRLLKTVIVLNKPELEEQIRELYHKTIISEVFYDKYIIAVSGLQGAGKTALIKELYGLSDEIMEGNIGRGEQIPILITEGNYKQCIFSKRVIEIINDDVFIQDKEIDAIEFNQIAKEPDDEDIYLELKVPFKIFNTIEKSFVLLPGIENDGNKFQKILMHSLISSATCIFLFDEGRFADIRNSVAINKIKETFKSAFPLYVLTRGDQSKDNNKQTYENFKKDFAIVDDDRIIISWLGDSSREEWKDKLIKSLTKYRQNNTEFRHRQLEELGTLIRKDFGSIITELDSIELFNQIEYDDKEKDHDKVIKTLQERIDKLRKNFSRKIKKELNNQSDKATISIQEYFINKDFSNFFSDFFKRDIKKRFELENKIKDAWNNSIKGNAQLPLFQTISYLVQKEGLLLKYEPSNSGNTSCIIFDDYNESFIISNDDLIEDFKKLMTKNNNIIDSKDSTFSHNFENNLSAFPVLLLEFARIVEVYPNVFNINEENGIASINIDAITSDFNDLIKNHSSIIRGIATMLGLDFAVDGTIDTIPHLFSALTGATAGSLAMNLAVGVGGVLSAIFLFKSIMNQIDKTDLQNEHAARRILSQIVDAHHSFYLDKFDEIMDIFSSAASKSYRYRLNLPENFTRRESLLKDIYDAKKIRSDILENIVTVILEHV